jgi:hypothetical protein
LARGSDNIGGVSKSGVSDNNRITNTYNNDSARVDKSNINKSSNVQSKIDVNNIGDKKAKFEEDKKKEPILQTIIDIFDGELLN